LATKKFPAFHTNQRFIAIFITSTTNPYYEQDEYSPELYIIFIPEYTSVFRVSGSKLGDYEL
jgi:hypothetical protein